jgi:uncharacterized protein YndB with AHSA1/START domain
VNAPRDLVWRTFAERTCLALWMGPIGMVVLPESRLDLHLHPGGLYHYGLRTKRVQRRQVRHDTGLEQYL